jgi:O-antigen/teichoic acid export membrane protein
MDQINQQNRSISHRTLTGMFWMLSGTGLQAVLQGVVLVVLVRLLTPREFGLVGAAMVVVGFSGLLSQLGVGPAIVQRPNLEEGHLRTGFTVSVLFGLLLAGFISAFAPALAHVFRMERLTPVLRAMSLVFVLRSVSIVAQFLLQREMKFRVLAGIQVVSYTLGYGVMGVVLARLEFGVWALVSAHLAQTAIRSIILLSVQPHPKFPQCERRAFNDLISFGGGFTLARISNYLALQGDNLVVGRYLGAEALGIYGRAYQLMVLPASLLGQVLDRVLFPAMAKIQNRPEKLAEAFRRGVSSIGLLVLPASAATFVLAPELIQVLLGPGWGEVVLPFQILTIGMLFRTSYKISDSLAHATGAVYLRAWRQALYAALVVAGAWIGGHWGVSGVAFGVLGAITANFLLMTQLSLRLTSLPWRVFLSAHLPALSLATIVFLEAWGMVSVMRDGTTPALSVLLASLGVIGTTLCLLLWFVPKIVLGRDGIWILETLTGCLPEKVNRFDWARNVKTRLGFDNVGP